MKKATKNKVNKDQHTKKRAHKSKKCEEEKKLDQALEETFPASDPITIY